jgi:hypothetical protein
MYTGCVEGVYQPPKRMSRGVSTTVRKLVSRNVGKIQAVTASRSYYRTIDEYVTEYLPGRNGGEGAKGRKRAQKGARGRKRAQEGAREHTTDVLVRFCETQLGLVWLVQGDLKTSLGLDVGDTSVELGGKATGRLWDRQRTTAHHAVGRDADSLGRF